MKTIIIYLIYLVCVTHVRAEVTDEEYYSMPALFHLDDFDRCLTLKEKSLYCSITVQLSPADSSNQSKVWKIVQQVSSDERNYRHDRIRHGICVPLSCSKIAENLTHYKNNYKDLKDKISECYTEKYENDGLKGQVLKMHCETDQPFYEIDIYDVLVGLFLAALFFLVVVASFYEGLARYKSEETYKSITGTKVGKIMKCFSIVNNWKRLQQSSSSPDAVSLRCINGLRFYSMFLVIGAHVCMVTLAGPIINPKFTEHVTENPVNMLFMNGGYLIQTFLFMAGWLLAYHFFLTFEGRKEVKLYYILLAFVNRYIRLTPSLLVMIALNATWVYHMGRGPTWDRIVGDEYRYCRENWWTNLLYINNYYNSEHMCMQQSWYLATDTQLFVTSLIIVVIMWNYQQYIKTILAVSVTVGVLLPGIINFVQDYDILIRQNPEVLYNFFLDTEQWHVTFSSGYTNFGGYAIGLIFGYIFYKYREKKVFTRKLYIVMWWLLLWGLPLGVIFLGIPIYKYHLKPPRLISAIYVSLARNLFALGIAIGAFGVSQNIGWFLRDCIIWQPLQVLGRLTYSAYLVHTSLSRMETGYLRTPKFASNTLLLNETFEQVVNAYAFGLLLSLFVELPTTALQKLMVPQLDKKRTEGLSEKSAARVKEVINNGDHIVSKV